MPAAVDAHRLPSGRLPDCQQTFGHCFHDLLVDFVNAKVAFDENNALGLAARDLVIFLPDAAEEGILFLFEAAFVGAILRGGADRCDAVRASRPIASEGKREEGEIGLQVAADQTVQRQDTTSEPISTAAALIGFSGDR